MWYSMKVIKPFPHYSRYCHPKLISKHLISPIYKEVRYTFKIIQQFHVGLLIGAPAFTVIAFRTGRHQIIPAMFPAHAARDHMIDRQRAGLLAAVLTSIVIAPKDLGLRELNYWPGAADHTASSRARWMRWQSMPSP